MGSSLISRMLSNMSQCGQVFSIVDKVHTYNIYFYFPFSNHKSIISFILLPLQIFDFQITKFLCLYNVRSSFIPKRSVFVPKFFLSVQNIYFNSWKFFFFFFFFVIIMSLPKWIIVYSISCCWYLLFVLRCLSTLLSNQISNNLLWFLCCNGFN